MNPPAGEVDVISNLKSLHQPPEMNLPEMIKQGSNTAFLRVLHILNNVVGA